MSKQTDITRVPKLRFPEFNGEWKLENIGKFIKDFKQKTTVQDEYPVFTSARTGLIMQSEYFEGSRISERDNIGYHILPPKHLTYRSRSDDRTFYFNENLTEITGIISHYYPVFKIINGKNKFFKELFARKRHYLGKYSVGTSQTVLSHKVLKEIILPIPSFDEQLKISACLYTIDKKISEMERKKELLVRYKKGSMNKLFSQEIRFKNHNGSQFPDWAEKRLDELFFRVQDKNKGGVNTNILTISAQKGLVNQRQYFTKNIASKDTSNYFLLYENDFAYNKSYSAGYPMGAIKRLKKYHSGILSPLYICFRPIESTNSDFYEQYFESGFLNHWLSKITQEGARNHGLLNMAISDFFASRLPSPHPAEQYKISRFLMAIDKRIRLAESELELAYSFKRGLLQQMFV